MAAQPEEPTPPDRSGDAPPERLESALAGELHVLVPHSQVDSASDPDISEIQLLTLGIDGVDGTVVPAFTTPDRLEAFAPPGTASLTFPGRSVAEMVEGAEANLIIDPGHDEGFLVPATMLQEYLIAVASAAFTAGASEGDAVLGRPRVPLPTWFADHVARAAGEYDEVASCYEALWFIPERHARPTPVLAVELDDGDDAERVLPRLWQRIEPAASELRDPVELICLNHLDGFLEGPLAGSDPIYRRDIA